MAMERNETEAIVPESFTVSVAAPVRVAIASHLSSHIPGLNEDHGRFLAGTLIAGRYRIISMLGRGGMGEVYRATDLTLGQSVALKFLPEDAARDQRVLERFHNEVRVARQVSHPNVCRVYDIGEAEGMPFISMEYVDGEDLASLLLRIGRLPSQKALEIARKLCAGLAAAHERGIIHRDLKPHNIMLNKRGEVVIMDFGLAAIAQQIEGLEARNGTPAYMAPEQLRGDSVTFKSDIYSLGLIIYELFTGKRAFEGRSVAEQLKLQESTRPSSVSSLAADADPAVENAIALCLLADPALRPASALAVAATLPGGDPLAAALAAGETPSPELVAASGRIQGFPLKYSIPCLAIVLIGLIAVPLVKQPQNILAQETLDFPPAVLDQKARDISNAFGFTARPADSSARFEYADGLLEYLPSHKNRTTWKELFAKADSVRYRYRESPQLLIAQPEGKITSEAPPFTVPGMVNLLLDGRGRLLQFEGIVARDGTSKTDAIAPEEIFRLAGQDFSKFREVAPVYLPRIAFDARRAWRGNYSGLPFLDVTFELATWQGIPTSLVIHWPWTRWSGETKPDSLQETVFATVELILLLGGLFFVLFFARRNLRLGRADRKGALRVAAAAFAICMIAAIVNIHFVPDSTSLQLLWSVTGTCLLWGALLWLMYIALEPAVRARWPRSLITWNRVLAGQFDNPTVGSHLLLGTALAVLEAGVFLWRNNWFMNHGGTPDGPSIYILGGLGHFTNHLSNRMFFAMFWGIAVFFLLSGLRTVFRRDWIAALVAGSLMMFVEGDVRQSANLLVDVPIYMAFYGVYSLVLLRIGLVPGVTAILILNTVTEAPFGSQWNSWFNWMGVFDYTAIAALAIYGFWRSQTPATAARTSL